MNAIETCSTYYFDRLVINTDIPDVELKAIPLIKQLMENHSSLWIDETSNTAKFKGYETKIDAKDVTEIFLETLFQCDLGLCGISSIEITRDTEFMTFKEAEEYQFHFERNTYRRWSRSSFTIEGKVNDSNYMAKKHRKHSSSYNRAYPIDSTKNPFSDKPAFHLEFTLSNWNKIQKILKIDSIYQLDTAESIFKSLEKRYLVYNKTINRKLLVRHLIRRAGLDSVRANERVDHFKTIQDFEEWLDKRKEQVHRKKHLQPIRRKMIGKAPIMNKYDKAILDMRMSYYLKDM